MSTHSFFTRFLAFAILAFFCSGAPRLATADIAPNQPISSEGAEILSGLSLLDSFTGVQLSGELKEKYNAVVIALRDLAGAVPGSAEAEEKLQITNRAYNEFLEQYGRQIETLKALSDQSFDEIFEEIDWTSAAYSACVEYREELLLLLQTPENIAERQTRTDDSLNDDLLECEARIDAAAARLRELIGEWETELQEKKDRRAELQEAHQRAVDEGNEERAAEIQSELDNLDEEIPELERKVEKSRKVEQGFDFEKLLSGLGKIALGVLTIIFSGECGEDAQGGCESIGIGLITQGGREMEEAFNPPDKTEYYTETETETAEREQDVVEKEQGLTDALASDAAPLCCQPDEIRPDLVMVQTDEEGPLSFGYETDGGGVSKIYLIQNSDGSVLAEIEDSLLFYARGNGEPELSTKAFENLTVARTRVTDGGTHIVEFEGALSSGGTARLAVAISPLTFSGKFKVIFRPAS